MKQTTLSAFGKKSDEEMLTPRDRWLIAGNYKILKRTCAKRSERVR